MRARRFDLHIVGSPEDSLLEKDIVGNSFCMNHQHIKRGRKDHCRHLVEPWSKYR